MNSGEILLVDLRPSTGNEQDGVRPALVVSTADYDRLVASRLVVVCPITSRDRGLAHHVTVTASPRHSLDRPSWIMTEQPRALSRRRIRASLGQVEVDDLDRVLVILGRFLAR